MTYTAPTVNYREPSTGDWLTMSGVQSVNISRGRQRFQDPVSGTSAVIEIIPTSSTTFSIGQLIDVRDTNSDSPPCYFQGRITDVQRSYAMPYNSTTGATPGDRIRISAAGATGVAGTALLTDNSWASGTCSSIIETLLSIQDLVAGPGYSNNVLASAQTFSGALLDAVNQLLRTAQLTLDDAKLPRGYNALGFTVYPTGQAFNSLTFTDTGSGYAYSGLEFLSSVQNFFNWIEVDATGVYNYKYGPKSLFYNSLKYTTFSATAEDTQNLTIYLWQLLGGGTSPAPFSISTNTAVSASCMALAAIPVGVVGDAIIGQPVSVTFRGSTTYGSVIGVNAAFYPDRGNVQLFLSPSLGTPFTLDSTAFGVLDTNRLGYP